MQTARRLVKGPDTAETSKKNLADCTGKTGGHQPNLQPRGR